MPHIHCYLDRSSLVWTMVSTDLLIGIAYAFISATLWVLIRRIKLPFSFVVLCFGVFIAACGATHFMEVWNLWVPDYWLAAAIKIVTAIASVGTAIYLYRLRAPIAALAEAARLSELNRSELETLTRTLEDRVADRTARILEIQDRFEKVSEATDLGVWYCDLPFAEFFCNRKNKEHFCFTPDAVVRVEDFYAHIHPEDREKTRAAIETSISTRTPCRFECRSIDPARPDRWKWIRADGWTEYDAGGNPIRFDGTTRDITEQKETQAKIAASELRYRTLTETLPQLVWSCRPDGSCDYLSQQWQDFTGVRSDEQLGMEWLERVIHPEDRARVYEHWMGAVAGLHPYDIEYRIRRFDGEYHWFKTRGIPVRDADGRIRYWFGTSTDIEDIRQIRTQLEESIRVRDDFISIASHELKTPLTSLRLHTQIFQRNIENGHPAAFAPEKVGALAAQTEKQVTRLTRLVEDMLDIGKIRAGRLELEKSEFDLNELLAECIERLSPQFLSARIDIPTFTPTELIPGEWDRFRLEQVITNLLTNALRYGAGKPVEIRAWTTASGVRFTVKDQGIGISPGAEERIFERFEREVDHRHVSGLGLGLFITRQIVEAHGGKIWVESRIGEGSTFTVDLPR